MYDDFDEYEDYEFEDIGLYEHKRSDKVKWIVSFLLIFVLLAGLIGAWVMLLKPENEAPQQEEEVVEEEPGTMDGKTENKKYFIMNAKIYARRFATDCFSDYFNDMAKKSGAGLGDYREYVTEKATVEELKAQNSYFINALYKEDDAA